MQSQTPSAGGSSPTQGAAPAAVFGQYAIAPGAYDELIAPGGAVRPVWAPVREYLDRLGKAEFARRWAQSQRLIYENGVSFSAYGDPENRPRPWALDPAPMLLHEAEWEGVSTGLRQRARLLELLLQDLCGPQNLVRSGVLPADLVLGHPGYRLPLHWERRAGRTLPTMLTYYAADLGRAPTGQWWVLADRTEAPSGAGFALENRLVTSRMLPEPFRDRRVRRLAPFFLRLQQTLRELAPSGRSNPTVAILSQGAAHPNYFEDAYLARYLGYQLVEGGDLTVRNRQLWMKTLEGLAPIDVVVRRPNAELCDPLELGGESPAGVAGLLETQRNGAVAIANACGSGLVESPAFMAFMPRLCQALLGEPLKLPGVATWWCGEEKSLDFVLANAERLIFKKAYRRRGEESLLLTRLNQKPRAELEQLIRSDPNAYVAQERVLRSTAPAWRDGRVVPVRVALRAFAVASGGDYEVMQGALARTNSGGEPLEASILSGEGSKDVWIVGESPVEKVTLLPSEQEPAELVRIGGELPSRVAEHSYWLGRYMERADAYARLARIVVTRLTSERDASEYPELPALVRGLAEQGQIEAGHALESMRDLLPRVEGALASEVLDHTQPGSLSATVDRMFASAAQVRDRLSRDTWRILLRISDKFRKQRTAEADLTDLLNLTDELVVDLAAIGGMVIESMTRTQFYRFLDIGRRLERGIQAAELIQTCLVESGPPCPELLEALVDSADSLMTYRARYRARLTLAPVLDLLVTDESNPRSLAYQLNTLERHVGKLPRSGEGEPNASNEQRLALSLAHAVRMVDVSDLAESYELGRVEPLKRLLAEVIRDLPALSNAIGLKYLAHAAPPRQLAPT
ncbi:circularly permuted type 2 ATP-grasp protein [Botrimarina sp.]|uniref:circularly permuted type 2 ATP-grasp protein n=1 Tax=Botrimarina sp. TaxID=2795802 RepID=UPI0032EBB8A8